MPGGRGRGGRRTGTPGKSYQNRTDLNQPMRAATGQPYGAAKAQMDAQRAAPLPNQPPMPGGMPPIPPDIPKPGSMGDLFADSQNPDEDVMSGATLGPGPGPAAFGFDSANRVKSELDSIRPYLPAMEFAAAKGDQQIMQVVRLLKSRLDFGPGS